MRKCLLWSNSRATSYQTINVALYYVLINQSDFPSPCQFAKRYGVVSGVSVATRTMTGVSVARRRYYLSISIPSEPILLPWVRTDVADFPYPLYLYITKDFVPWRPDAVMSTDNYISHSPTPLISLPWTNPAVCGCVCVCVCERS